MPTGLIGLGLGLELGLGLGFRSGLELGLALGLGGRDLARRPNRVRVRI